MAPQNTPPCPKDYFELIILRNRRHRSSSETKVEVTLLQEEFTFTKEISVCESFSFSVPGREG